MAKLIISSYANCYNSQLKTPSNTMPISHIYSKYNGPFEYKIKLNFALNLHVRNLGKEIKTSYLYCCIGRDFLDSFASIS